MTNLQYLKNLILDLIKTEVDGKEVYYAFDGKIGYLGSWLTHLSLIIIILAFAYGRYQGFEEFVHGVPGTVMNLENSDYKIKVDQYDVMFRKTTQLINISQAYLSLIRMIKLLIRA